VFDDIVRIPYLLMTYLRVKSQSIINLLLVINNIDNKMLIQTIFDIM